MLLAQFSRLAAWCPTIKPRERLKLPRIGPRPLGSLKVMLFRRRFCGRQTLPRWGITQTTVNPCQINSLTERWTRLQRPKMVMDCIALILPTGIFALVVYGLMISYDLIGV
jgi:hypothetical protein